MPRSSTSERRLPAILSPLLIAALTAAYAVQTIPYASAKPFWHDEIYTVLLAGLPSLADTWRASLDGADLAPPLNLWLTRGVHAVAGPGLVSTRLPAFLGVFVALLAVFAILRRRAGLTAATSGALVLFFTAALRYAAEARGYGAMVGLSAVALYAWLEAAAGRRRRLHVAVLGAALAASLWNHYFGVLVFAPIVAGEAVRVAKRRRFDAPVAAAIAAALISALPLTQLAAAASRQRSTFWSRDPGEGGIVAGYRFLFAPMLDPLFFVAAGVVLALLVGAAMTSRSAPDAGRRVPAHETVAVAVGLGIPVLGVILGTFVQVVVPRYLLSAVPFIGIALPLAIWRANTRRSPAELFACAFLAVFVAASLVGAGRPSFRDPLAGRDMLLNSLKSPAPTVVSSSLQFLQLWYYTPRELKGRMVYLADPAAALERSGSDTIDRGYLALARWTAVPVEPFRDFVATHSSFRVYEAGAGWLPSELEDRGAIVEEISRGSGERLLQVTMQPTTSSTARRSR